MATFIRMPQKGLTEESAILTKWYVQEGQAVAEGQYIFALETGKATFDVEAETSGTVLRLLANEGDEVPIKKTVCVIGTPGESFTIPGGDAAGAAAGSVPSQGQSPAPPSVPHGAPAASVPSFSPETPAAPGAAAAPPAKVKISPRARRLARTHGLDCGRIPGTGPGGRVIEEDVAAALRARGARVEGASAGGYTAVPSGRARETAAASMFAAHARFDASRLLSYCGRCNAAVPGAELGISDLVAFAVSRVLLDFPCLNAQVFDGEARLFAHVHLGIAVDTPQGLLFPTLRNADTKSLIALSRETRDLAALCREGKALPEDLADGTFSLSDIGACNVDCFTPIINPPQVAALGIGGLGYKRKKTGDGMADYPALGLSLSVDRRAAPGAPAAAFLEALCGELENFPLLLAK